VSAVKARDLWKELEVKTEFSRWFQRRLEEYEFTQGIDFSVIAKFDEKEIGIGSGRKPVEYVISSELAVI